MKNSANPIIDLFDSIAEIVGGSSSNFFDINTKAAYDILEKEKYYELLVNLPGIKKTSIKITKDSSNLFMKIEEREQNGEHFFYQGRSQKALRQKFPMPPDADLNKIKAKLTDGVLKITVLKEEIIKKEEVEIG